MLLVGLSFDLCRLRVYKYVCVWMWMWIWACVFAAHKFTIYIVKRIWHWVSFAQQRSQLLLYMYNVQCMVNLKKPLWQVKRRENTVDVSVCVYHSIHVHDACLSWIFTIFGVFGNFRLNEKQAKQEWDKNRTTKPNNRHTNIELLNAFGMICGKFCCCFERCKLKKNPLKFHLNGVLHVRTYVISFGWYEYYVCLFG